MVTNKKEESKELSLEEMFEQLENLATSMEGQIPLEQSFELYKQGMDLASKCNARIDKIEKEIKILDKEFSADDEE